MKLFSKLFGNHTTEITPADVTLRFNKGELVKYRDVEGFFVYEKGPESPLSVFHRSAGNSGKRIVDGKTFNDYVTQVLGSPIHPKDLGQIEVRQLVLI